MRIAYSTSERPSKHWQRIGRKHERDPHRITEQTFETVRLDEFAKLPSRRHCLFIFDLELDPDFYADSMNWPDPENYNLVEIEVADAVSNMFRADKSLVTSRIVDGKLTAEIDEVVSDARKYWSGYAKFDLEAEILFCGQYAFTRIIRPAEECFRPYLTNPAEILVT